MRILIVEDNAADVGLIEEMLKEATGLFTIDVTERSGSALNVLASQNVDVGSA